MFSGSIVAIVTPFQQGAFDKKRYIDLLEFQLEKGTHGIVPCGCTGEAATLSHNEHKIVIDATLQTIGGKIPVIAGTGSNSTNEAIMLTQFAESAGANAALIITPYYNKPTQEGLYRHYATIAESTTIPIILYNVPSRTGVNLLPETVARLMTCANIVAIKEAGGSLDHVSRLINLCGDRCTILSGDDFLTLPMMSLGAKGVISVAANVCPKETSDMVSAALEGRWEEARRLHHALYPLFRGLFLETNPIPVKTLLALEDRILEEWRLPLCSPSEKTKSSLRSLLDLYRKA
ncbi:MAG: 4-hydroxy-tetrahydrodipicolinate synthase [Candidatus Ratteibacteria bacterium]|jgi:4-hydroxy-tetrahydrodipicolinate synthase